VNRFDPEVHTMMRFAERGAPICAAALLSCVIAACRTSTATGAAAPRTPAPAPVAVDAAESRAVVALDTPPRVVVMPSGNAYLVLGAGPEQRAGALTCDVLYLAGDSAGELALPDAQGRLALVASEFVAAFAPIIEVSHVDHMSVTAVFGRPGARATVQRLWFVRDVAGWRSEPAASEHGVAQFPRVVVSLVRDPLEEASARAAAAEFIADADRGDYDAAWARTSALVKATMSRVDFDRTLSQRATPNGDDGTDLYVSFAAPPDRFLPGAIMELWAAHQTAKGPVVETLAVRLDDDMEWRVVGIVQVARTPAPQAEPGALQAAAF
jgi:hypothetical protein